MRLGVYEVAAQIGEGGMGQVFRATDTKLKRQVAIKILPPALAADHDRLARFQREAEVLASLNHPHIAGIYGLEESDGVSALVMELIEGEDLAQRIARGPIPIDEALPLARQIAEALEAAHQQGVIHRDLKPANIKVRADGTVKVLDFGLAKLVQPKADGAHTDVTASPTITSPLMMTGVGVILGTAAYMSPEQAKGREADKRSDIWAFGAVLYEMLTGRRAFDGEDMTDVLGAVTRLEPDWKALPADVPPPVRTLLESCLVKDRQHRITDISTVLFVLEKSTSLAGPTATALVSPLAHRPRWRQVVTHAAVALVMSMFGGAAVWFATRHAEPMPPRVSRLSIAPSGVAALTLTGSNALAITPDGFRLVYVGNRGTQLFVRALDSLEAVPVFTAATPALSMPFVSPDHQWIGFSDGGVLTKVAATGGPAVVLTTLDATARGATWGPDDAIVFATSNPTTGLQRVAADGGPVTVLTRPDRTQGEADHLFPELLPGGRAVLFTITSVTGGVDAAQVAVLDLATGTRTILVRGGSQARYVASAIGSKTSAERDVGHLVYAASDTLRAVAFDATRLETRGSHEPLIRGVARSPIGTLQAVVARDGTLAYVQGGPSGDLAPRTLVWVDRQGRETPISAPGRRYVYPRLSPDGSRIAVVAIDQEIDVWIWNFNQTTLTRATLDSGIDHSPMWTPDGVELIFSSERAGIRNLYRQRAESSDAVERLTQSANRQNASDVSADGRRVIFTETTLKTGDDVMQVELGGSHPVTPLIQSVFAERNGIISPDGRWIAYESNASGQFEVWVRPFPSVTSGQWQVSTAGGTRPHWTRKGQELVYVSPTGALMRVGVARGASWSTTPPTLLIKEGYVTIPQTDLGLTYDVAPDGERFLMIKEAQGSEQTSAPATIIVVLNWVEELKRLGRTSDR